MAASILTEGGATAHPHIDTLTRELYATLKTIKQKDMTEAQFDLFVLLEGLLDE